MKQLSLSASLLVLVLGGTAMAAGPSAPNFGGFAAAPAPQPAMAVSMASVKVPAGLSAGPAPVEARPVTPGVNPFAAAPAATPAPAAAGTGSFAPTGPAAPNADAASTTADDGAGDTIDDAALRYYASQRDLERVGAEIRRLKALHPDWQPPADLFSRNAASDETQLWDLFAKKDFVALDKAIAERGKANPGWKPSEDLAAKIAMEKARSEITVAADRKDWNAVTAAATRYPSALTCANIDLLWSLGEGYARLQNFSRAFDLYAYILKTCDDPAQRISTYQKADELLPPQGAEALAGLGRSLPNGSTEFASLRFDPVREQMGKIAAGEPGALPSSATLDAFAADVGQSRSQGDALLFGWYLYAQKDYPGAAQWFRAASNLGSDPKATEGYILALRNNGQVGEASSLAYANRTVSPEIAKIYVEILSGRLTENDASATLDAATMQSFSDAVDESKSALGAQSLGWNLLAHEKLDDARAWFQKSVEWQPSKEGVTGLAVVAARSKNKNELRDITKRFGDEFPELASLQVAAAPATSAAPAAGPARKTAKNAGPKKGGNGGGGGEAKLLAEANAAFKSRNYAETLSLLDKRKTLYGRNGGAEVLRGWANLKLGRYDEARRVFKAENSRSSTKDTRFGIGAVSNEQYSMWE